MDLPINTNSKSGTFGAFARSKAIAVAGIFSIAMTAQGAPVTLQQPTATFSQASFSIADAIDNGPSSGWAIHPNVGSPQTAVFETATDLFTSGGTLTFTMARMAARQIFAVKGEPISSQLCAIRSNSSRTCLFIALLHRPDAFSASASNCFTLSPSSGPTCL